MKVEIKSVKLIGINFHTVALPVQMSFTKYFEGH